jgi:hypothetical protein
MMQLANKHRRSNHTKGQKKEGMAEIKEGKGKVVILMGEWTYRSTFS